MTVSLQMAPHRKGKCIRKYWNWKSQQCTSNKYCCLFLPCFTYINCCKWHLGIKSCKLRNNKLRNKILNKILCEALTASLFLKLYQLKFDIFTIVGWLGIHVVERFGHISSFLSSYLYILKLLQTVLLFSSKCCR